MRQEQARAADQRQQQPEDKQSAEQKQEELQNNVAASVAGVSEPALQATEPARSAPCIGAGAGAALEPVQQLCGQVDLVAVTAIGETRQFVQILRRDGAVSGTCTNPFSIIAVCACMLSAKPSFA